MQRFDFFDDSPDLSSAVLDRLELIARCSDGVTVPYLLEDYFDSIDSCDI